MTDNKIPEKRSGRKSGKIIPALCNIIGVLILLAVIAICLPMTVPRLFGYQIFHVISGSMEPEIPVGSVIYVAGEEPDLIQADDIIAFRSGEAVIAHRVIRNNAIEGEITTKGDANAGEDVNKVHYSEVIGVVRYHVPYVGRLFSVFNSTVGKIYIAGFALCGLMFNLLAGRIRRFNRERYQKKLREKERQRGTDP